MASYLNSWLDLIVKLNWYILITIVSVALAIIFLTIIPFGFGVLEYFLFGTGDNTTNNQGKCDDSSQSNIIP